ncbi:MAG TPA: lysophospholipid acyltransferase family protein [Anaeromyxobacter sp.]
MTRLLARAQRILLTGSAFLFFFLGGTVLSYVLLPLAWHRGGGPREERARRCRGVLARAWRIFHWYMQAAGLLRYDPRSVRLQLPDGPFVMVANHPTLVDVTAIVSACPQAVSIAKSAMFRSPLVGRLLRYCDHIDAGDGSPFSGVAVAERALALLASGTPILVFPEGTRSPERGLGEFRHGPFEIAARAGVPVVPLFLTCDPPTLMRGRPWYEVPERMATLTVIQLPTLRPPHGPARDLASALRSVYLERLARAGPDGRQASPSTRPVATPHAS